MRRLYVGGLSHVVTERDLKDRFGKFGSVEDVELRTRRDEEGVPYKTFGYININISDADLKKCLTVLNKSKWKGGTLQIESAKESFLDRLAQERQAVLEQRLQQPAAEDKRQKLLDSLTKAGVDNFTMKAAVPGTEIPGHKDWIVSKFGRVLPVLQLKCQKGNRARTMKYDPSKYSHNIRKLDRDATDEPTPITQLTWEVQGGDDDISKKRRGEFPPYQPPRSKKGRGNAVNSHNAVGKTRPVQTVDSVSHTDTHQLTNGFELSTKQRPVYRREAYLNGSDVDSDEEIRRLVAAQQTSHSALQHDFEDNNLEVVGLEYSVKSGLKGRPEDKYEDDYDSADTDELFASRKPPPQIMKKSTPPITEYLSGKSTDKKRKTKRKGKAGEQEQEDSSRYEEHLKKPSSSQERWDSAKDRSQINGGNSENQSKMMTVMPLSESDSDEDDDEESADSCSDPEYEAMFSNVTHMEISMADLQRLAEEAQETSKTTAPSILTKDLKQQSKPTSGPAEQPSPRKGTLPEDILAAIMEEDCSEDEQKKKRKKRKGVISTPLPAFQGTRTLNEGLEKEEFMNIQKEEEENGGGVVKKQKLDSEAPHMNPRTADSKKSIQQKYTKTKKMLESSKENKEEENAEEEQEKKREVVEHLGSSKVVKMVPTNVPVTNEKAETSSSSSTGSDDEDEEDDVMKMKALPTVLASKTTAYASLSSSRPSSKAKSAVDALRAAPPPASDSESSSSEEEEEQCRPRMPVKAEDEEERQRKANLRRLAAVQQRQKEAEEHKKLIQGALANLDTAGAGKRIVFDSDDEDEDDQQTTSKKTLFQDSPSEGESTSDESPANENSTIKKKVRSKASGPQLFGDDEDDGDKEEDGARFDIRPQFEGRSGQKLMELQSRFGTDERFRMDSRFLEEEEESERKKSVTEDEEVLGEERKKNLEILQSVLGSSLQTCSKPASKAKTFRDVSVLHYDPSKDEHAAFETTTDEAKKESKSARRKKRQESQKLPEVSKEIFFDISGNLKAVFGPTQCDAPAREDKKSWDQEEEEVRGQDEEPPMLSSVLMADPNAGKEESTGFKFSFFGDDPETENGTEYKVGSIQAPKVSWQQDPRFHDSSSDEDEAEQEEDEEQTTATEIRPEETLSIIDLFFFHPEDSRLTDGPRLFCRPSELEEQREEWEERRTALRQEYRKKHKDARRKLKSTQKS